MSNLTAPTLGNLGDLLTSQMPGTGELIKSQLGSLTFDQLLATMKQPSCADISNPAARASPVLPTTVAPVAKITPFSGTADEFAAAFPGFLRTAAVARGLDPHNFEKEASYITGAVQACAKITPQMRRSATDQYGRLQVEKLGDQYQACGRAQWNVSGQVKPNAKPGDPAIWIRMGSLDRLQVIFLGGPNSGFDVFVAATIR